MAKILIFTARPDDALYSMGASMIKLGKEGNELNTVLLSTGQASSITSPNIRVKELENALDFTGSSLDILNYQDCTIHDTDDARHELAEIIRQKQPDIVLAPYHTNNAPFTDPRSHPDLTALGTTVKNAVRFSGITGYKTNLESWKPKLLVHYMTPLSASPSIVSDVSKYMQEFENMMNCLETQMNANGDLIMKYLIQSRNMYGSMVGAEFGEPFMIDGPIKKDLGKLTD